MHTASNAWLRLFHPAPDAPLRLFCIPFVGGAASSFATWGRGWNGVEVCPIQLPGREKRFLEAPLTSMAEVVDALANSLPFDKPYVLMGHSLGGMVAFELTRAIVRAGSRLPSHLIVSGCPAPQIPLVRRNRHRLSDEELVAHLRALGGTPDEVLSNRELLELALPVMRADFKIADHYTYEPGPLLPVPITAYGGDSDTEVTENMVAAWRTQTSSTYTQRMFAGGHFFIQQSEDVVLAEVWQELSRIRSPVSLSGTPGMRHTS